MTDIDKSFEDYRRKWQTCLRLSDAKAAMGFLRSEAADLAGGADVLEQVGKTGVSLRVDGRGLDGSTDPGAIPDMVDEWQADLDAAQPADPRDFTKRAIVERVGRNLHTEPDGYKVLCATLWLAVDGADVMSALEQGDVTLVADFTFDDVARIQRLKMWIAMPG